MKIVIPYLQQRGFDLIKQEDERFLMKKGKVCVVHHGKNSYEIFKHIVGSICYSEIIKELNFPNDILTKVKIINEL